MSEQKVVIGLECHVQLDTESKLFCSCPTTAEQPNSSCCEICLGMPGSKPVLNKKALDYALAVSLALNCHVNSEFFFSRKTYFYPDMSKNFQITQYEIPVGVNGFLTLSSGKKIRIRRVHLEEDPAALVHEGSMAMSRQTLVDYNRSGIPLVEIVTEPDLDSPQEARDFLDQISTVLQYLKVFDAQQGTLKVDSNISLQGSERVEVKNITGKKGVEKALVFEAVRQKGMIAKGEQIVRETRSFNEGTNTTKSMRTKETEDDYGYIFEPDLTAFELGRKYLEGIKSGLPELHDAKAKRFMEQYGLEEYSARVIAANHLLGEMFEEVAKQVDASLSAKFLSRELLGILNYNRISFDDANVEAAEIAQLLKMVANNEVSEKNAKEALIKYVLEKVSPSEYIESQGLKKDIDEQGLTEAVEKVLGENAKAVTDLKAGEKKALHFLVGKVMQLTKGKAEAREVQKMIEKNLVDNT